LSTYAFATENSKAARRYVDDGLQHLKQTAELNPDFGDALALMSSFYGYKIALRPWLGFIYGPRTGRYMGAALILSPNSPRVHLLQGISLFYTPAAFGGSKEGARESFEKSLTLFAEPSPDPALPDWGHSETWGWLGLYALDAGDSTAARQHFDQALAIDPDNNWVRHELLPLLEESEAP
jgi:tetratricopeptide (TPR) repeat protein